MIRATGAELAVHLLERQDIRHIAGIPGGCNLPLYDALSKSAQIKHILTRHEQGAGFVAQGIARTSGKPAVFFATSGPGATNTLTALADAKLDSVPIICITGQVSVPLIGTDAFQEVDIYGMSLPVTKHNFLVRSAEELANVIPEAFAVASSGRPGPVLIDVPKDVQTAEISLEKLPLPGEAAPALHPDAEKTLKAAAMLNRAERPLFLFGGGCAAPENAEIARQVVEGFQIPAAMSLMGLGVIPADSPLSLGMLGMHGSLATNMLINECDLLIVVGARFDDRATGKLEAFCPRANIIHIDTDPGELGKLRTAHVALAADSGLAMRALAPLLEKKNRAPWLRRAAELKRLYPLHTPDLDNPCSPYGVVRQAAAVFGSQAIVTTDVGQHQMRVAQAYPFSRARQWLTSGGLGTMGFGLPAAIGASLQNPSAPVLCFTGDGSLMMNIQEMATAAECGANVKIILCNNMGLGLVQQQQELFYGGRLFASGYSRSVDFTRIAEGFGIPAMNLNAAPDPRKALARALEGSGPCLVEVMMDAAENVFPMVPPGADNCAMLGAVRREGSRPESRAAVNV